MSPRTNTRSTTEPVVYELDDAGCLFVNDRATLDQINQVPDTIWIDLYNSNLRRIILAAELSNSSPLQVEKLEKVIFALNLLAEYQDLPCLQISFLEKAVFQNFMRQARQHHLNLSRRRLIRSLIPTQVSQDLSASHLPHSVTFDKKTCNGCGDCFKVCPQKAFSSTQAGPTIRIELDPVKCNGCGLCESICQNQSLSVDLCGSSINLGDSSNTHQLQLHQQVCSRCQRPFTALSRPTIPFQCPICMKSLELHGQNQTFKYIKGDLRIVES